MDDTVSMSISNLILLLIPLLLSIFMILTLLHVKKKNQLHKIFIIVFTLLSLWFIGLIAQITLSSRLNIDPIYFEYFIYVAACTTPVALFFLAKIFTHTKINFKKTDLLLFIVPVISLLVLWTNDFHHLFYKQYSVSMEYSEFGPYMFVHSFYSYALVIIACVILIKYSIQNSGFFSKQSILIFLGSSTPVLINMAGYAGIISLSVYSTPISFTIGILCFALAAFKLQFFNTTPIALQRIVDRMSDGYIIVNEENQISDFNQTFLTMLNVHSKIRNKNFSDFIKDDASRANSETFLTIQNVLKQIKKKPNETPVLEYFDEALNKTFSVEVSGIVSNRNFLGTLILFKDITQHVNDMKQIKNNQDTLMEKERLASLGQLIGGIAHNLKTPIMSISGAAEGLSDLIKEYDSSIDDPEVNSQDHHDIAKDMSTWVAKIKTHTEYMSDVITAVKGQAVTLSTEQNFSFTVEELLKRVDILMKHELKNAIIYLNVSMKTDEKTVINGDVNSLVQVINNMISNSIQAYGGKTDQNIDLIVEKVDNNLVLSIKDYGSGMSESVKDKLFKEMVTTKGKNGTGLGLYMSYSTIRGRFNGNITVDSEEGKGTTFKITLPL